MMSKYRTSLKDILMKKFPLKQLLTFIIASIFLQNGVSQAGSQQTDMFILKSTVAYTVNQQNYHFLVGLGPKHFVMNHVNRKTNAIDKVFKLPHASYLHTFAYEAQHLIMFDAYKKQIHFLNPQSGELNSRYTLSYQDSLPLRSMAVERDYFWFINQFKLIKFDRKKSQIVSTMQVKGTPNHGRNKKLWNFREGSVIIHQNSINKSAKAHCKHAGIYEVSKYSGQVIRTILKGCYSHASVSDGFLYYRGDGTANQLRSAIIHKLKLQDIVSP